METTALNELVSQRQKLCEIRGICIDVEQRMIKGYTKAKFLKSQRLSGQVNSPAGVSATKPGDKSTITSFLLQDILKSEGIDYLDNY